jgi:hypothetical protein
LIDPGIELEDCQANFLEIREQTSQGRSWHSQSSTEMGDSRIDDDMYSKIRTKVGNEIGEAGQKV